ncbi:MAG: acetate kinase [Bacilli bacterium]|nr:acetate kinase [Bacilli bacterium]
MMKILAINSSSRSLKFSLFEMDDETIICNGIVNNIGMSDSRYTIKYKDDTIKEVINVEDHFNAIKLVLDKIIALNIISSIDDIYAVGHRIIHGKDIYNRSVIIDNEVVHILEDLTNLTPVSMRGNLDTIKACIELLPNTRMVGVFDTAFHQTMEKKDYLYAVPYEWFEKYSVRKYGFYGINHRYVSEEVAKLLGKDEFKLISCHLGNGTSICAIKDGKSMDTSMGFTPLTGAMMGTRSGDVDSSIIPYIMEKEGKNALEVIYDLNKNSGLLGMSEYSSDMKNILERVEEGDEKASLALDKYVRRVVDYIGQYYLLLGGVDAIVFTGGIGENSTTVRRKICEALDVLGVKINLDDNQRVGENTKISTEESKIQVYIIPSNEEIMIARDTLNLVRNGN